MRSTQLSGNIAETTMHSGAWARQSPCQITLMSVAHTRPGLSLTLARSPFGELETHSVHCSSARGSAMDSSRQPKGWNVSDGS